MRRDEGKTHSVTVVVKTSFITVEKIESWTDNHADHGVHESNKNMFAVNQNRKVIPSSVDLGKETKFKDTFIVIEVIKLPFLEV